MCKYLQISSIRLNKKGIQSSVRTECLVFEILKYLSQTNSIARTLALYSFGSACLLRDRTVAHAQPKTPILWVLPNHTRHVAACDYMLEPVAHVCTDASTLLRSVPARCLRSMLPVMHTNQSRHDVTHQSGDAWLP